MLPYQAKLFLFVLHGLAIQLNNVSSQSFVISQVNGETHCEFKVEGETGESAKLIVDNPYEFNYVCHFSSVCLDNCDLVHLANDFVPKITSAEVYKFTVESSKVAFIHNPSDDSSFLYLPIDGANRFSFGVEKVANLVAWDWTRVKLPKPLDDLEINIRIIKSRMVRLHPSFSQVFGQPQRVKELLISRCQLRYFDENILSLFSNLFTLDLSMNEISKVTRKHFPTHPKELTQLLLNNNKITMLPRGLFQGMDKLQRVWLEDNPIMIFAVPVEEFNLMPALQEMKLTCCSGCGHLANRCTKCKLVCNPY